VLRIRVRVRVRVGALMNLFKCHSKPDLVGSIGGPNHLGNDCDRLRLRLGLGLGLGLGKGARTAMTPRLIQKSYLNPNPNPNRN
jgi:hypothetical protein